MIKSETTRRAFPDKPRWYNAGCAGKKRIVNIKLKKCRKTKFSDIKIKKEYLEAKREYNQFCSTMKRDYKNKINDTLTTAKTSSEFWNAVNKCKFKPKEKQVISKDKWEDFYNSVYPQGNNEQLSLRTRKIRILIKK